MEATIANGTTIKPELVTEFSFVEERYYGSRTFSKSEAVVGAVLGKLVFELSCSRDRYSRKHGTSVEVKRGDNAAQLKTALAALNATLDLSDVEKAFRKWYAPKLRAQYRTEQAKRVAEYNNGWQQQVLQQLHKLGVAANLATTFEEFVYKQHDYFGIEVPLVKGNHTRISFDKHSGRFEWKDGWCKRMDKVAAKVAILVAAERNRADRDAANTLARDARVAKTLAHLTDALGRSITHRAETQYSRYSQSTYAVDHFETAQGDIAVDYNETKQTYRVGSFDGLSIEKAKAILAIVLDK